MKLETEITSQPSFTNHQSTVYESKTAAEMLEAGIKYAKDGSRAEARALLTQVTENEPENETAWLWMASISEYPEELLVFLQNVLIINPQNERALEWIQATKSMIAKTFVERGINASQENRREFANQCFLQALMNDTENEMAWLCLASNSDSPEEKMTHLQKVLSINPENETALASLTSVKHQILESLLKKANSAAISGERGAARQLLEEAMETAPELEEAWILKAYLADDSDEKITCYEKILDLNPENEAAQAGLASLKALMRKSGEQKSNAQILQEVFEGESRDLSNVGKSKEFSDAAPPHAEEFPAARGVDSPDKEQIENSVEAPAMNFASESQTSQNFIPESFESPTDELDVSFVEEVESQGSFSVEQAAAIEDDIQASSVDESQVSNDSVFEEASHFGETDEFFEIELPEGDELEIEAADSDNPLQFPEIPDSFNSAADESSDVANPSLFEVAAPEETADNARPAENFSQSAGSFYSDESADSEQTLQSETNSVAENFAARRFDASQAEVLPVKELAKDVEIKLVEEESEKESPESSIHKTGSQGEPFACPFCYVMNEPQAFACVSCHTMLSLSDMETLLSYNEARPEVLEMAIEDLESERASRGLNAVELTNLGIAHLNAKNLRQALTCLQEAAQMIPNDVVLASKVKFLAIRLSEIEVHESKMDGAGVKNLTIMVVDDSPTVRKLISSKLEKCGHTVVSAADGFEALEHIKEVVPDLVLLDIMMPQMDGYQVCKLIRGNESTKDVPVIMISGKDGFFDKVRGRMAGTSGFISKPFGPETLMRTIETYVN